MQVDIHKYDFGHGIIGLLVRSLTGMGSLTFTPEDEGVVPISTRIAPDAKKRLEKFSEIGGVSMSVITRICIERGLDEIADLVLEVKKAKEKADQELIDQEIFDREAHDSEVIETLSDFRKESTERKSLKK